MDFYWIKKHKKVLYHSWLFEDPKWYAAWDVLLLEANDEDGTVNLSKSKARVWFTRDAWSYFVKKLEADGMIEINSTYQKTKRGKQSKGVISKYWAYQGRPRRDKSENANLGAFDPLNIPQKNKPEFESQTAQTPLDTQNETRNNTLNTQQLPKTAPIYKKREDKNGAVSSLSSDKKPAPMSSEEKMAQYLAGKRTDYNKREERRMHLQRLTGDWKIHKRKDTEGVWFSWYEDFDKEFIELAWEESKTACLTHWSKNRIKTFISLLSSDYGSNSNLKRYLLHKEKLERERGASQISIIQHKQGDTVQYKGKKWEVTELLPESGCVILSSGKEWAQVDAGVL